MEKKYFFGWGNIKRFLTELVKTFSNEPSFFASKRIERAFLFGSALYIVIYYVHINVKTMESAGLVIIITALFGYAGYNTTMIRKDKIDDKNQLKDEGK